MHRHTPTRRLARLLLLIGLVLGTVRPAPAEEETADPSKREVPLPCAPGWRASLVIDNGETGIWTVKSFPVFEQYACPEVIGLDDRGRCLILVSYSGKWTPLPTIEEKKWLGGLTHGDVDPRLPGAELYTGGQLGNLYQVVAYPHGATDHRLIARFEGREIHTVVSGDLDPRTKGSELLVFTRPGGLYRVTATGPHGTFETTELQQLPGRVRDAIVLPADGVGAPEIATVSRAGKVELLRIGADGPTWRTVHEGPMGRGRLALAPRRDGRPVVLYSTQDDGVVLRHARVSRDAWKTEVIYNGPQGMRGIAAGRFHADADEESLVVFGYSGRVELLTRAEDGWTVETIFEDRDKGHWLSVAELDGRNATQEIIGSGYGGRIFLLSRPPGFGCAGPPVDPAPPAPAEEEGASEDGGATVKVGVMGSPARAARLDPLTYGGGFQAKTLVYETLVLRDEEGRIAPGLASSWRIEEGGRTFVFTLREGARFHDGSEVDAAAVETHFRRWVGLPEHGWLGANERIRAVVASGPRELRVKLDRPYALLPDLCAINPCAIRAPAALDRDGDWLRPVGSGPFRWIDAPGGGRLRLAAAADASAATLELLTFGEDADDAPFEAFERGALDLLVDGWYETVPRARVAGLRRDPALRVTEAPGSSVWYLSFRLHDGPTSELAVRRRVLAAVDRAALVYDVEHGLADPCVTVTAPAVRDWPAAAPPPVVPPTDARVELTLLANAGVERERALADALARQLGRAGLDLEVRLLEGEARALALETGDYDLWLEHSWGLPYDPDISLRARCLPRPGTPAAARERDYGVSPELRERVARASAIADEEARVPAYREIQALIDRDALFVPLYVPRRVAVARGDLPLPHIGPDLYRTDLTSVLARPLAVAR